MDRRNSSSGCWYLSIYSGPQNIYAFTQQLAIIYSVSSVFRLAAKRSHIVQDAVRRFKALLNDTVVCFETALCFELHFDKPNEWSIALYPGVHFELYKDLLYVLMLPSKLAYKNVFICSQYAQYWLDELVTSIESLHASNPQIQTYVQKLTIGLLV